MGKQNTNAVQPLCIGSSEVPAHTLGHCGSLLSRSGGIFKNIFEIFCCGFGNKNVTHATPFDFYN